MHRVACWECHTGRNAASSDYVEKESKKAKMADSLRFYRQGNGPTTLLTGKPSVSLCKRQCKISENYSQALKLSSWILTFLGLVIPSHFFFFLPPSPSFSGNAYFCHPVPGPPRHLGVNDLFSNGMGPQMK